VSQLSLSPLGSSNLDYPLKGSALIYVLCHH